MKLSEQGKIQKAEKLFSAGAYVMQVRDSDIRVLRDVPMAIAPGRLQDIGLR